MDYLQSLRYLDSFINLEKLNYRPDQRLYNLDRMKILLDLFHHPEKNFFPVIIAGTKGKGSTGFFLESILKEAGIRVGFYNSPHLLEPTERIRLNGNDISKKDWVWGIDKIRKRLVGLGYNPGPVKTKRGQAVSSACPLLVREFTYFEILTLLSILVFARKKIQVGIFEVGMGGRLDATNILKASLVLLTPISLDHEASLGNTIAAIAREKAGVIHSDAHVVTGPQPREALKVIRERCKEVGAVLHSAQFQISEKPALAGDHQKRNAALALKAFTLLKRGQPPFMLNQKGAGPFLVKRMKRAFQQDNWHGRFETIARSPDLVVDGAHNPASAAVLKAHLMKTRRAGLRVLIFGTARDKNYKVMLEILSPCFDLVIVTAAKHSRARETGDLIQAARSCFKTVIPVEDTKRALVLARQITSRQDQIVATGSFYLIGEIIKSCREPCGMRHPLKTQACPPSVWRDPRPKTQDPRPNTCPT